MVEAKASHFQPSSTTSHFGSVYWRVDTLCTCPPHINRREPNWIGSKILRRRNMQFRITV